MRDDLARPTGSTNGETESGHAGRGNADERRRRARRGDGLRLRDEIVEAASDMLASTGEVGALSLRGVARAIGIAPTSSYLHFHDLDELVLAVKTGYFTRFGEALDAAARAAGSVPTARVRARALAYVEYGTNNPGRYRTMFSSPLLPPALARAVRDSGVAVFGALRDEITAAVDPREDAGLGSVHLWTALHGIVTLRAARPTFDWPDLRCEIDSLVPRVLAPTSVRASNL